MTGLLDVHTALEYARRRGVLSRAAGRCVELGGGVSNVVLLLESDGRRVVLKQALGRLRVAETWEAPVDRIHTEAQALQFAADILPGLVPAVLDTDAAAHTMTLPAAPEHWRPWKESLLAGDIDDGIAARLGSALGALHSAPTAAAPWLDQAEAFHALRVDPYHHAVAARLPAVAPQVLALTAEMAARRRCFVHGDYSPKNVLTGDGSLWLIDFEVAHLGDPAFDVAFLLNHLLLKSVHRPQNARDYHRCGTAFLDAYGAHSRYETSGRHLVAHIACLMLARTVGKSPAEYLDTAARDTVTAVATRALIEQPERIDWIWNALTEGR